jgi:hypothetical protein
MQETTGSAERYSLQSARAASAAGRTAEWVGEFLASEGSDNPELAAGLASRRHWWVGPVRVPLGALERLAGPERDVLCPIEPDEWAAELEEMEESLEHGWLPPPLLAQYLDGRLVLQDGNHRFAALEEAGATHAWTLIFFDDPVVFFDDPVDRDEWLRRRAR